MPFLTQLVLEAVENGWVVRMPLVYDYHGTEIVVPVGMFTDLASVPRLFWSLYPRDGAYRRAAVLHDWLVAEPAKMSWAAAADVFEEAMKDTGVPWLRRKIIANAVRLRGLFK